MRLASTTVLLVGAVLFPTLVDAATTEGSDRCDSSLLPQVTITSASASERVAYLSLVTESNYEQARAGGALNIIFENLPIGASYQQFDEKRRAYLSRQQITLTRAEARALFRQSLSEAQLQAWQSCMTSDLPGVRVVFKDDDSEGVSAVVHYVEAAGRTKDFRVSVRGGSVAGGKTATRFTLSHDGARGFDVIRASPESKIRLTVNGSNMTDSAVSLPPLRSTPPVVSWRDCPEIYLLSAGAPTTASANSEAANNVTDGDTTKGIWNSQGSPPQWVEISLKETSRIRHLSFNPEQAPAGYTQHRVYGIRQDGAQLLLGEYNAPTISGGVFTVLVDPHLGDDMRAVRVETISGPSWVAWREVQIYGCK